MKMGFKDKLPQKQNKTMSDAATTMRIRISSITPNFYQTNDKKNNNITLNNSNILQRKKLSFQFSFCFL
jgi:hypothetical protein